MERDATMDPFGNLVAAIQEGRISDVEHWLQLLEQMHIDIAKTKLDGGQLSVVGHIVVSKSDPKVLRILLTRGQIDVNYVEEAFNERFPLLHLAAYVGNLEVVTLLCNSDGLNLDARLDMTHLHDLTGYFPSSLRTFRDELTAKEAGKMPFIFPDSHNNRVTALHCAAFAGHSEIVAALVQAISTRAQPMKILNAVDDHFMTPLHYGVIRGDVSTIEKLSSNSKVKGNLEEKDNKLTALDMAYSLVHHAKNPNRVEEYELIKSVLLERGDVQKYMEGLNNEKQRKLNALGTFLVSASLVSNIAFQSLSEFTTELEPYTQSFLAMSALWSSLATLIIGAASVLPRQNMTPKGELNYIHISLILTSRMFAFSIFLLSIAWITLGLFSSKLETLEILLVVLGVICVAALSIKIDFTKCVITPVKRLWSKA